MKVKIEEGCIACGVCVDSCPDVFQMGDDVAEVINENVPEQFQDQVKQAAQDCPVDVIIIE